MISGGGSECLLGLSEIDEGPAVRAAHQAERKWLYEIEYPETRHVTERGGPGRGRKTTDKKATVSDAVGASAKTGVTMRTGWARGRIPAQRHRGPAKGSDQRPAYREPLRAP